MPIKKNKKFRKTKKNTKNIKNIKNTKTKKNRKNRKTKKNNKKNRFYKSQYGGNDETMCPSFGFEQHRGECWNDTLMTLLSYSDGIGKKVQSFFTYLLKKINLENAMKNGEEIPITINIIKNVINRVLSEYDTPKYRREIGVALLPINIHIDNEEEIDIFKNNSVEYIANMFLRYENDKLNPQAEPQPSHNSSPPTINIKRNRLMRRLSINTTMTCIKSSYNIYNVNKKIKKIFDIEDHAGGLMLVDIVVSIINYYIMTMNIPEDPTLPINPIKDPYEIMVINLKYITIYDSSQNILYYELDELLKVLNEEPFTYSALYLSGFVPLPNKGSSHAVGYYSCSGKNKYYNDNHKKMGEKLSIDLPDSWKNVLNDKITQIKKQDIPFYFQDNKYVATSFCFFKLSTIAPYLTDKKNELDKNFFISDEIRSVRIYENIEDNLDFYRQL